MRLFTCCGVFVVLYINLIMIMVCYSYMFTIIEGYFIMSHLMLGLLSAAVSFSGSVLMPVVSHVDMNSHSVVVEQNAVDVQNDVFEHDDKPVAYEVLFDDSDAVGTWLDSGVVVTIRTQMRNVGETDVDLSDLPSVTYGTDKVRLAAVYKGDNKSLSKDESCELIFTGVIPFECGVFGVDVVDGFDEDSLSGLMALVEKIYGDVVSAHEESERELRGRTEAAMSEWSTASPVLGSVSDAADRLIYIQWGSRPEACWPIQIRTPSSPAVECGSMAIVMAAIMFTGDYTITPNSMWDAVNVKYGGVNSKDSYKFILRYIEEEYGVHHKSLKRGLTADQAREILAQGHMIQVGQGCSEIPDLGLPFCKAEGVEPRCSTGHTIVFYKYENGYFYAKDSAPGDGAAQCLYPDGPLTVTHRGLDGKHDKHAGQTESFDNYADEFFKRGWCVELWCDNPASDIVRMPDSS